MSCTTTNQTTGSVSVLSLSHIVAITAAAKAQLIPRRADMHMQIVVTISAEKKVCCSSGYTLHPCSFIPPHARHVDKSIPTADSRSALKVPCQPGLQDWCHAGHKTGCRTSVVLANEVWLCVFLIVSTAESPTAVMLCETLYIIW